MNYFNWLPPNEQSFILNKSVHLWLVQFDKCKKDITKYKSVLSDKETARYEKFHFENDRLRYIISRGILKILLSDYADQEAEKIEISINDYEKPFLKNNPKSIEFNISHSGNLGLIGITQLKSLGVDIEQHRKRNSVMDIAKRFFTAGEIQQLLSLDESDRLKGFFNGWTRKEAFIKALGKGLAIPLNSFDVSLGEHHKAQFKEIRYDAEKASDWILKPLNVGADYSAAFAIKADQCRYYLWDACKINI